MPDSALLLSATPLLMRVEPLRQDPVPVVAQGEPDEREHVKVEPGDEYFLYERGRIILLGLSRLRDFVFFHSWINNKLANLGALWGVHPITAPPNWKAPRPACRTRRSASCKDCWSNPPATSSSWWMTTAGKFWASSPYTTCCAPKLRRPGAVTHNGVVVDASCCLRYWSCFCLQSRLRMDFNSRRRFAVVLG